MKDKWLRWAPRMLAMGLIGFFALFSLDAIRPGLTAKEILVALLIHNIPVFFTGGVACACLAQGMGGSGGV